jgi:hypothetical protein
MRSRTFPPDAAHPALRMRFCSWRRDRRLDHPESLRAKDLIEGGREFTVAVADQDARPLLQLGEDHRQIARLLDNPGTVGVGGDASEIDATP